MAIVSGIVFFSAWVALIAVNLHHDSSTTLTIFTGLLQVNPLANYLRGVLLLFGGLLVLLTYVSRLPESDDVADFHGLLLGGTVGLMLMVSANHLMLVFLGLEMASLPSYMLSGFRRNSRVGSEAALKYAIYGAASAGVTLYGISLLAIAAGTGDLPTAVAAVTDTTGAGFPLAAAGGLFFLVGLGFKLAAVPFHFWLPDVFAGATAEVAAFLAVASKAAAIGLGVRLLLLASLSAEQMMPLPTTFALSLIIVAAATTTLGNLAALPQTNLQRLFGYSTIAHSGVMVMGLATMQREGLIAVLVYLAGYFPMNLGAFAAIACLRTGTAPVSVDAFRGLARQRPEIGVPLVVFVMSLLGLPPLAGFVGKFLIFIAVFTASQQAFSTGAVTLGWAYRILLGVGLLNTLISLGYYLRIVRAVGLDVPEEGTGSDTAEVGPSLSGGIAVYFGILAAALLILGLAWGPLLELATTAVAGPSQLP